MLQLVLLTACLTIPVGGTPNLTVYPVVEVSGVPLPGRAGGFAAPFLVVNRYAPGHRMHAEVLEHEMVHHRQMRNLGFATFATAYVLTGSQPFEHYRNGDKYMMDFPTYNACGGYL